MLNLILFLLLTRPFSLGGAHINDDYIAFQNRYLYADCRKETETTAVCEQEDAVIFGRKAWMRAEFKDSRLTYISFTSSDDKTVAKKISDTLTKQYGSSANTDNHNWDNYDEYWLANNLEIELSYTSAIENGLGHPILRISLQGVQQ